VVGERFELYVSGRVAAAYESAHSSATTRGNSQVNTSLLLLQGALREGLCLRFPYDKIHR
jgi:hypothetical protein